LPDLLPDEHARELAARPARWLVTGAAGFIGSNLVEALLRSGQCVTGVDDFSTGFRRNLDEVRTLVGDAAWTRFRFVEADVCDPLACRDACDGVDFVLHQAALGSVPRSIEQPLRSFDANVAGFVRILDAARTAGVRRFVYASSSSVYGDSEKLPKVEDETGSPLSPYAATKAADELFAAVFARTYAMSCVGLRYFNVFGPRQDPDGAYAAVIPRWTAALLRGEAVQVHGDGQTSRDFCYVANAVQANVRAALAGRMPAAHEVFNVAVGRRATLLGLLDGIREAIAQCEPGLREAVFSTAARFGDFRAGDVRHSLADISKARRLLRYEPTHELADGLRDCVGWYLSRR
jgi:UDP-N-acetylglucosamine 4-epimerase